MRNRKEIEGDLAEEVFENDLAFNENPHLVNLISEILLDIRELLEMHNK